MVRAMPLPATTLAHVSSSIVAPWLTQLGMRSLVSRRTWAITCLTLAFAWQLYTLWLLVRLHEPVAGGVRYSRYMHLATTVFGAFP